MAIQLTLVDEMVLMRRIEQRIATPSLAPERSWLEVTA
jgi:hypothetical protein